MPALVTTLLRLRDQADAHFEAGRLGAARMAFAELLESAQERADVTHQVTARVMLARCALGRRALDEARDHLGQAASLIDPDHLDSYGRYRAALVRLALVDSASDESQHELLEYLHWAEEVGAWAQAVDACELLAERQSESEDRLDWLQRGIDHGLTHQAFAPLARMYTAVGAVHDRREDLEQALESYQQALHWQQRAGNSERLLVGARWAVGTTACRVEDWPLAFRRLGEVVNAARAEAEHGDFLALALTDLAVATEASGDVIEARRLLVEALRVAREQELAVLWPERHRQLQTLARRLEVV